MLFLRSLLFFIGMITSIIIFTVIALVIYPLPFKRRYSIIKQWARFIIWWLEKTCHIDFRVKGRENIPKAPMLILSKHQSAWETIAYQQIFPIQVWLLKRELLMLPFFGWALATLNPISIDRKNIRQSMQKIIKQGKQRLSEGSSLIIFPEGTRVKPGETKRYGIGGAILAVETKNYPVIPVAINSGKFWAANSFIKYPGTIDVIIGPAINPRGKTYKELNQLVHEWIEEAMQTLP
ncbi:MAG: 1-acyl-sn-glycerol-3-phosphate acyltransferase [Thiomargarita sp.]|nr:1-acyl-sn-glycerol-3-phosphate acyltransferase [Thiomargarita sp.]